LNDEIQQEEAFLKDFRKDHPSKYEEKLTVSTSVSRAKGNSRRVSLTPNDVSLLQTWPGKKVSESATMRACDSGERRDIRLTELIPVKQEPIYSAPSSSPDGVPLNSWSCEEASGSVCDVPLNLRSCEKVLESSQYPLMEELNVLSEPVNTMQVDLS
jgi:hypothetical protein